MKAAICFITVELNCDCAQTVPGAERKEPWLHCSKQGEVSASTEKNCDEKHDFDGDTQCYQCSVSFVWIDAGMQ